MNTSEFAKMCGVEKRTLFHYDDIGLLKPAFVRENGYREYTVEQLGMMDMIKIFQACGYPLSEIKRIGAEELQVRYDHIGSAIERIDAHIEQLHQMKLYLQAKQRIFSEYQALPAGGCQIHNLSLCFEKRKVELNGHFFSFLRDGMFSISMLDGTDEMHLCRLSSSGPHVREGMAITFFLEIPVEVSDLRERISNELKRFGFQASYPYFVESLPHFLLDDQTIAVLKVTAFAQADTRQGDSPLVQSY